MKRVLIFIALSMFWTVLFFPKYLLWDHFSQYVDSKGVKITAEKKVDARYKFELSSVDIFFQKMQVASIKRVAIKPWILYNEIYLQDIESSNSLPIPVRFTIKKMRATYTILSPKKIEISGFSNLGIFKAKIEVFKHRGYVLLKKISSKNSFIKSYFKKTKEGMKYEFSY